MTYSLFNRITSNTTRFICALLLLNCDNCYTQLVTLPEKLSPGKEYYAGTRKIFRLLEMDSIDALSKKIDYPLCGCCKWPLRDIDGPKQFKKYYPLLADSFKYKLRKLNKGFTLDTTIYCSKGYFFPVKIGKEDIGFGIDLGGRLLFIPTETAAMEAKREDLLNRIREKIYPAICDLLDDGELYQSQSMFVLISYVGDFVYYVSWTNGHSFTEKPDLILRHGLWEPSGSAGRRFLFDSGKWHYVFYRDWDCDSCHYLELDFPDGRSKEWKFHDYYPE